MVYYLRKYLALPLLSLVVIGIFFSFKLGSNHRSIKEKIYLHTDKPYYSRGDTIWFKAYLTLHDRPIPDTVSGTCYVDLITEKNLIDTTLKLLAKGGLASGYLALGDMRMEGIYRLRAYTKYMLQNTVDHTFDRAFIVGDGFSKKIVDGDVQRGGKITLNDSNLLTLKINASKQNYKPRELVELDISSFSAIGNHPIEGDFSISVVDEAQVPYQDGEQKDITATLNPHRDMRELISSTFTEYSHEAGTTISGIVKSLTGDPIANGKVSLLSLNGGIMEEVKTTTDGKFKFEDLLLYGNIDFMVQARSQAGSKNVEVTIDKTPEISYVKKRKLSLIAVRPEIDTLKIQEIRKKQEKARIASLSRTQRLNEVNIKAKRREDPRYATQGGLQIPEGHSDQTYIIDHPESCPTLGICLQGKLQGVIFVERVYKYQRYSSYPAISNQNSKASVKNLDPFTNERTKQLYISLIVILDGRKLDTHETGELFSNNTLSATDIAKIEVVRNNPALAAILGGPSILIYTKGNKDKFRKSVPNIAYTNVKGMQLSKTFHSPNYDSKNRNKQDDLRSTVYWNPGVQTDVTGHAKVQFYAADNKGTYKVTIQGMAKDGKLGSQIFRFNVGQK